jgi:hypothetical protein
MFDNEWKTAYMLGKYSRGPAKVLPPNGEANADNFHWAPLVNVYTQNREYPNGSYDAAWTHAQCSSALDSMEARIKTILDRGQQWDRIVADVPQPMAHAISLFRDLSERYERLQREAEAAKLDHSGPRHQGRFNAHHNENPNYYNSGRTFF